MYHRSQCGTDRQGKQAGCMASTMLCRHWWRISGPRTRCTRHCFPQRTRACICSLCCTQRHSYRHNLNAQQNKAEESGDHKHLRVLPRTNALTCVPSLHLSALSSPLNPVHCNTYRCHSQHYNQSKRQTCNLYHSYRRSCKQYRVKAHMNQGIATKPRP